MYSPLSLVSTAVSAVVPSSLSAFGSSSGVPSPSAVPAIQRTSWSWRPVLRSPNQRSPRRHGAPARGKSHRAARRSRMARRSGTAARCRSVRAFCAVIHVRESGASESFQGPIRIGDGGAVVVVDLLRGRCGRIVDASHGSDCRLCGSGVYACSCNYDDGPSIHGIGVDARPASVGVARVPACPRDRDAGARARADRGAGPRPDRLRRARAAGNGDGSAVAESELADALLLSRSGVTRLVDRMVAEGLVERVTCETDRRGQWASLTRAGHARPRRGHADPLRGDGPLSRSASRAGDLAELERMLEPVALG